MRPPRRLAVPVALKTALGIAMLAWGGIAGPAPSAAWAEISRADLARVGVHAAPGARAPLDLGFIDQHGHPVRLGQVVAGPPVLLLFEDFRCQTLCGPALSIVADGVARSGLAPGRDLRLVAIGLNPREAPKDAQAFSRARLANDPALAQTSLFLTGTGDAIVRAAGALGYDYAYDPATDQFTHPVAAFVLADDGRLTRVLGETALTGGDLRAAVGHARRGEVGDLVDRLALLCHDLSPLSGRYDGAVQAGMRLAAIVTLLAMAGGFAALMRRRGAA